MQRLQSKAFSRAWRLVLSVAALVLASFPCWLAAEEPETLRTEVARLVQELDRPQFAARSRAAYRLRQLADDQRNGPQLSAQLRQLLIAQPVSFEVHAALAPVLAQLPAVAVAPPDLPPDSDQIAQLLDGLASARFSDRSAADARLDWWLSNPRSVGRLLVAFKTRLADESLSDDETNFVISGCRRVRAAWLCSNDDLDLPALDTTQIKRWTDELVASEQTPAVTRRRQVASEELLDALCRGQWLEPTSALLTERLQTPLSEEARARVQQLLDWTQPALAAEYWSNGHHYSVQNLLVGVPQFPETALKASYFDRCDDRLAHCVSGNSLSPGDHRVGVAIVHPSSVSAMFHLVNLPTPRRRLAHCETILRAEADRLREISEHTTDAILAERRHLDEENVMLLAQLDAEVVSNFVGKYFAMLPDQPFEEIHAGLTGQATRNRAICHVLAERGTPSALPALAIAAANGQVSPPAADAPLNLAWIAALAIAGRSETKDAESFLVAHLDDAAPLAIGAEPAPTVGASAAALLVARHGGSLLALGVEAAPFSPKLETGIWSYGVEGFRYTNPLAAGLVRTWWEAERAKPERTAAAVTGPLRLTEDVANRPLPMGGAERNR